jgi:aryl-alcohol dehydrogenase-like predicted oxidoreductase
MSGMTFGHFPGARKPVARILYGTARKEIMLGGRTAFRLLDEVADVGATSIETARAYPGSERTIGRWMRERGNRESVVIVTKGAHGRGRKGRVTPADIRSDVATSLKQLGTDRVEVYLLHRDDPNQPVGPIVEVLNELHVEGRIGAFGGSNWTHERIQSANQYALEHGLVPFAASSPNFGLAEQVEAAWDGVLTISGPSNVVAREWYACNDMPIVAWSSMGRGFFSGRIKSDHPNEAKKLLDGAARRGFAHPTNFERLERVEKVADEKGYSVAQIALAWVLNQPLDVYPVVSASSGRRMQQNIDALGIRLTPNELSYLDLARAAAL